MTAPTALACRHKSISGFLDTSSRGHGITEERLTLIIDVVSTIFYLDFLAAAEALNSSGSVHRC